MNGEIGDRRLPNLFIIKLACRFVNQTFFEMALLVSPREARRIASRFRHKKTASRVS